MSQLLKLGFLSGVSLLISAASLAPAAGATTTVGPGQLFAGLVNGRMTKSTVDVVCPGPARSGQLGHPVSGQTIGVESPPPSIAPAGDTGSLGTSIRALIVSSSALSTAPSIVFTQYGSQALPTSLMLPCFGSGTVSFTPRPGSKTAKSSTVSVEFANIAVTPTSSAALARTASRTILVTRQDSGRSYRLKIGDVLDVDLSGPQTSITWTEPESSNESVLRRTGGTAGAEATATFEAAGQGKVEVTSNGSPICSGACPMFLLLFEVNVTVTG